MANKIVFNAKNLAGEICQISYRDFNEIPLLITQCFGYIPLYEPVWLDENGNENFSIKNGDTVYILYRYINIPITFINDWTCIEQNTTNMYTEYTLLIEAKEMLYIYEEITISFYHIKSGNRDLFYSEKHPLNIIEEDYGANIKCFFIPYNTPYSTCIKDMFLLFRDCYQNIPEDFYDHLSNCVEDEWGRYFI